MKLRKILIGSGIAATVLIGGVAVWLSTLDLRQIVAMVEEKALESTGRALKIKGPVSLKWSLIPTVIVEELSFANAPWGSRPQMLSVKRAEVSLAVLPLLSGKIEISRVELDAPDVLLEVNRKGERNWDIQPKKPDAPDEAGSALEIDIASLSIRNGALQYRPAPPAKAWTLALADVRLRQRGNDGTLNAQITANQLPIKLEAEFARSASTLDIEQLTLELADASLRASGTLPLNRDALAELALDLQAKVPDPAALARALGSSAPKLPAFTLEGRAAVREKHIALDIPKLQLGTSQGTVQIATPLESERPNLVGKIEFAVLDLREIGEASQNKKESNAEEKLFSADPLPLAALNAADANLALAVRKLILKDGRTIEGISAQTKLAAGRMQIDPFKLPLGGQTLSARVVADARSGKSLAVDISANGKGIPLAAINSLVGISNKPPEGAPTDISLSFSGRGASMRTLMASANGDLRVIVGPGHLPPESFKLGEGLSTLATAFTPRGSKPGTELQCAVIRVPIRDGIAKIDNGIAAETTQARFIGGGTINLREETLDIGVRPRVAAGVGLDLGSLTSMVRVGGTLAKPGVRMDAAATATNLAEIGLAMSTGGLSLPATRLFSNSTPEHPCEVALGKASATASKPASDAAPATEQDANPLNAIRRLFGQ